MFWLNGSIFKNSTILGVPETFVTRFRTICVRFESSESFESFGGMEIALNFGSYIQIGPFLARKLRLRKGVSNGGGGRGQEARRIQWTFQKQEAGQESLPW